ncbi:MAG: hypothetical protein NZL91_00550 [Thermoflexales bacterium]|nr:hypothetical protein [Thermoflexales bacterium]MCS7323848.1 hypothetical protein [Thermoflexales bacterium]MCX7938861.1 hypothetical protein [Thermoflexales bacterium]MDW8052962.1 hypothetical protein [Anaerolineae bacterium]MDW8291615.1 hypothetical protein [Anaerolineae bacterium]
MTVPSSSFAGEFDCPGNYIAATPSALRCAKCNRPLDIKDAQRIPTGYVCPYYVKARVATFYNANLGHYLVVGALCLVIGVLAGFGLRFLGASVAFFSLWLTLILSPLIGGGIAELVRRVLHAMGKARGQRMWVVGAACTGAGGGIVVLPELVVRVMLGAPVLGSAIALMGILLVASVVAARLREF